MAHHNKKKDAFLAQYEIAALKRPKQYESLENALTDNGFYTIKKTGISAPPIYSSKGKLLASYITKYSGLNKAAVFLVEFETREEAKSYAQKVDSWLGDKKNLMYTNSTAELKGTWQKVCGYCHEFLANGGDTPKHTVVHHGSNLRVLIYLWDGAKATYENSNLKDVYIGLYQE